MPSKVPNEILIKIFQQLHPFDQLECTLVCHRWNQLLEDSVLYHTVYICSPDRLEKLLHKIQQRPDIASRIERLLLLVPYRGMDNLCCEFLTLIPNLKVLCHNMEDVLDDKTQYPWCNRIEYISEDSEHGVPYSFLSYDAYPNLKTFSYNSWESSSSHLLVKNAPALTNLSLTSSEVKMGFDDLECIHKNSPHLRSIKLSILNYSGGAVFSGKEITPATSVTELVARVKCDDLDDDVNPIHRELHAEFLVYVSRKYPNLSALEYKNQSEIDIENDEIIQTGWNSLLQRLGPQLKKVSIYFSSEQEQHMETFDKFDCQINYLDLYCGWHRGISKVTLSNQAFYIQTLVLRIKSVSLDWLKSFRVLKKLELTYKDYDHSPKLQLSDILDNSPPTLESLLLCADPFDINPRYTGTSNIKILTFESMKFDDKVDGFISRCFPQLSVLELRKCKLQNKTLNLEKTDLINFYYYSNARCNFHDYDGIIMVTTLKDNKRRFYDSPNTKDRLEEVIYRQHYQPFKSYPASDINDSGFELNFICNSVRNVDFAAWCLTYSDFSEPLFITYK